MAKKHRATEGERQGAPTAGAAQVPEVELPEMSGFGIHFDDATGKYLAVRVTNFGTVEVLSPRGVESKHSATARVVQALGRHVATVRRRKA